MKLILFFTLLFSAQLLAAITKIEFKNGSDFFRVTKTTSKFSINDKLGERHLDIKSCNKEAIEKFWNNLESNANSVKSNKAVGVNENVPWIKIQDARLKVFPFKPAFNHLKQTTRDSHTLFVESKILCQKI